MIAPHAIKHSLHCYEHNIEYVDATMWALMLSLLHSFNNSYVLPTYEGTALMQWSNVSNEKSYCNERSVSRGWFVILFKSE